MKNIIKNLLTSKRYFNAKKEDQFINNELVSETNLLKPQSAKNIFDFNLKFEEERNASFKFCLYGPIESKWGDCENLKIDFYIGDSSFNEDADLNVKYVFWSYDKSTNQSGFSTSLLTRTLDGTQNGSLSRNLYGKRKGNYFYPFELDINLITPTSKSIFLKILDPLKNLYDDLEIPFLYFDEEGEILRFGQETAEILDSGEIIEINNNYPFFYDRHWIRREIEPIGPNFIYFVEDSKFVTEGGSDPDILENKVIPIEISMTGPSKSGLERAKVEILYGLDENLNEYTTVKVPQESLFNSNYVSWENIGEDPLKIFNIQVVDDFEIEKTERLTLKLTPIFGLLPDKERSQIMSIYFEDNDKPSRIYFETSFVNFYEPRQDDNFVTIPIVVKLDKKLIYKNQSLDIFIDQDLTDCESVFGFEDPNNPFGINGGLIPSTKIELNKTDLTYSVNLIFFGKKIQDIERKIVLKMNNLTAGISQLSLNPNQSPDFTIFVNKQLDDNFITITIPYDTVKGYGVLRNVYNAPDASYLATGQKFGSDFTTKLSLYDQININDLIISNASYQNNIKQLVFEKEFEIQINNLGNNMVFDNKLYRINDSLTIKIDPNFTSTVSSNVTYDGAAFKIKLPANNIFIGTANGINWGYKTLLYKIFIKNNTFNYPSDLPSVDQDFYNTNIIKKDVCIGTLNANGNYDFADYLNNVIAGNAGNLINYNLITQLSKVESQIDYGDIAINQIESYSSQSTEFTINDLYFNGAVIIPKRLVFITNQSPVNIQKSTQSVIFLAKDIVLDVNDLTIVNDGLGNTNTLLPVSNLIFPYPFVGQSELVKYKFGKLFVQSGYNILNVSNVGPTDSFIAKVINPSLNASSAAGDFNSLFSWDNANLNTKIHAVIEIENDGVIAIDFEGNRIEPTQKIWITEIPLSSKIPNVINIVKPLADLEIELPTNSNYNSSLTLIVSAGGFSQIIPVNKFLNAKYKISFLNFKIYNANGIYANKIFNHNISVNDTVNYTLMYNPAGGQIVYLETKKFLRTVYSPNVLVNKDVLGNVSCGGNFYNWRKLTTNHFGIVGMIATGSDDANLVSSSFVNLSQLNPFYCSANGISWAKY